MAKCCVNFADLSLLVLNIESLNCGVGLFLPTSSRCWNSRRKHTERTRETERMIERERETVQKKDKV